MVRILFVLLVLSSAGCLGLWWQNDNLTADNAVLADDILKYQSTIESKEATISGLQKDLTLKEKVAIERQQQTMQLQSKLKQAKDELIQLSNADETVKDWANQPVPSSVSRLLSKAQGVN